MQTSPAIDAVRHVISVLWDGPAPDDAAICEALDRLLAAYHSAPPGESSNYHVEPPESEWRSAYEVVGKRFSDYGFYPTVDPLAEIDQDIMMGDAIDDIIDITRDLREVLWRADNLGRNDAHWCLHLFYFHWGLHARNLASYLHARRFGQARAD